jgi:hypothetical protein
MKMRFAATCAIAFGLVAQALGAQISGARPAYLDAAASGFPNEQAIAARIWAPGLEDGFVPQGIAVEGAHVLMSAYRSDYSKPGDIGCRVFRVEAATGKDAGAFDLPDPCTHAGGLAYLGGGILVVADTRRLWRIDLARALAAGRAEAGLLGTVRLAGALTGSFAAFDGKDLWIGTYTREDAKARLYRLDPRIFAQLDGRTIREDAALESIPIPVEGQGAAFDAGGGLWIATSSSMTGALHRLDRKTGAILARYDMIIGVEGLAFDAAGRLWNVSESGARRYLSWSKHFPVIFAIDVTKLQ